MPRLRCGVRIKTARCMTRNNSCVIRVGREDVFTALLVGVFNHAKQGPFLVNAINCPRRVENFMPTVFRVRLCKHHELCVGRIAAQRLKRVGQIIDFVVCQGQSKGHIGAD